MSAYHHFPPRKTIGLPLDHLNYIKMIQRFQQRKAEATLVVERVKQEIHS
jgi:hypothetical protein